MKRYTIALLCAFAAVCAVAAWAQTESSTMGPTLAVSGKLISWSSSSLVLQTDKDVRMTFALDAQTTKPATDPKPGDMVTVDYHTLANGTFHAAEVELGGSMASTTTTTTTEESGYGTQPTTTTTTTETEIETETTSAAATDLDDPDDAEDATYSSELPQTASPFALVGLIGLLALAGAAGLHVARRS